MGTVKTDYGKVLMPHRTTAGVMANRSDVARFLMICMVLLTLVSIFHVWSRFRLVELNLELGEASRQMKGLEQENRRLLLESESLRTPARIEAIAKRDLGMVVPKDDQVILVK